MKRRSKTPMHDAGMARILPGFTDRKGLSDALRESEARFRSLVNSSPDIICRVDRHFRHLYVNPAGISWHGIPAAQVVGKTIRESGVPGKPLANLWEERIRKVFKSARLLHVYDSVSSPSGLRHFDSRFIPEFDAQRQCREVLVVSRDITERTQLKELNQQLEQRVQERTDEFELAQEAAGAGTWDWDIGSGEIKWSHALFHLFGLDPRKERAGFGPWKRVLYPDDRKMAEDRIKVAIRQGTALESEYRIILPSGEIRWIRSLGRVVYDGGKKPVRMLGICLDITDRKRMENALSNERDLYKDLVATAPVGVYRVRVMAKHGPRKVSPEKTLWQRFTFEETSKTFCRIFGVTPAQCNARVGIIAERIHPDDQARFIQANAEGIKRLVMFNWEGRILKNKAVRWVQFRSTPRPLGNGDVVWTGIVLDITDHKLVEEALRQSEALYRGLFEQAAASIVVFDPETTRILEFNDAAHEHLGYSRKEFANLSIADIDVLETPADVARHGRRVVTQGHRVFETKHRTKNGTLLDIEVWPKAVRLGNKTVILAIWRDITKRKQLEVQLKAVNEQLESKVKERTARLRSLAAELTQAERKERLRIANLLHEDLQQRLVAMKYKTESLMQSGGEDATLETAKQLTNALDETVQLTRTLTQSLVPPVLRGLGLCSSLEWLANDMDRQYGLAVCVKGNDADRSCSEALQFFVIDAVRELLLNVHKHAGVKSAEIRMRLAGKKKISIAVCDQGKGMADSHARDGHFGLFSIRERAQAMGIRFSISSGSGKGSRVTLTLPTSGTRL